jgi:uncharacterized protein (TIGR02996 family)
MTDHDALLAAILANPDEDTPRLMFADWLDENGDADRAEFVRVQCELARIRAAEADLPVAPDKGYFRNDEWPVAWQPQDYEKRRALLKRESELVTAHGAEWRKGLPKYADNVTTQQDVKFRRGFVGHATVPLGRFTKSPAALWEQHPVESILLTYSGGNDRRKVPKCRPLVALRELHFLDNDGDSDTLTPYAECPYLSALRKFNLGQAAIKDDGALALSRSPHLRPVALELVCWSLSAKGLAALLNASFASRLRSFKPSGRLPVGAMESLAEAPLGALHRLELRRCIADEGVELLTRSGQITHLVTLDLSENDLTDVALRALAAWPGLAGVLVLNLGDNLALTERGLAALLESPYLRPIHLGLSWTRIGDDGAKALAEWAGLANLISLDLTSAAIGDAGASALARSPHWRDIRHLNVSSGDRIGHNVLALLRERVGAKADVWG